MELRAGMTVDQLVGELGGAGVQGAGDLARACDILERMVREEATVFLGISGPMVPSGLRNIITWFIKEGHASAVVTSGANVVHDMMEAFGGGHYVGDFHADDEALRREEIGRIGNVFTRISDFQVFEDRVQELLSGIDEELRRDMSVRELLDIIGSGLDDENSFLRAAHKRGVPVFSPGLTDSMLGLQLFFFSEQNDIVLNAVKDMKELSDMVFEAEKTGAVFLGGGVPKHYILGANLLREGIDYGIQVTLDREEGGSLSGAKLEEAVSWSKAQSRANIATVIGDATVIFPIMAASLKERLA
ncbi:MAG: deoxyhypusine synthase [Euryarchaeota archaeon]|nr:deoxyhypusine synthase [Euryarchaeota archaeon]